MAGYVFDVDITARERVRDCEFSDGQVAELLRNGASAVPGD